MRCVGNRQLLTRRPIAGCCDGRAAGVAVMVTRTALADAIDTRTSASGAAVQRKKSGSASSGYQPAANGAESVMRNAADASARRPRVSGPRCAPAQILTGRPSSAIAVAPTGAAASVTITGSVRPVVGTRISEPVALYGMLRGSIDDTCTG